jgi:Fe-S-cluster containining protein
MPNIKTAISIEQPIFEQVNKSDLSEKIGTLSNDPCDNCGICCLTFSLPPFDANELVKASDALLQQVDAYARSARYRKSNPCLWLDLDSGKCKHHKSRPVLCRWFEPGCQACDDLRVKAGLPSLP